MVYDELYKLAEGGDIEFLYNMDDVSIEEKQELVAAYLTEVGFETVFEIGLFRRYITKKFYKIDDYIIVTVNNDAVNFYAQLQEIDYLDVEDNDLFESSFLIIDKQGKIVGYFDKYRPDFHTRGEITYFSESSITFSFPSLKKFFLSELLKLDFMSRDLGKEIKIVAQTDKYLDLEIIGIENFSYIFENNHHFDFSEIINGTLETWYDMNNSEVENCINSLDKENRETLEKIWLKENDFLPDDDDEFSYDPTIYNIIKRAYFQYYEQTLNDYYYKQIVEIICDKLGNCKYENGIFYWRITDIDTALCLYYQGLDGLLYSGLNGDGNPLIGKYTSSLSDSFTWKDKAFNEVLKDVLLDND